MSSVLRAIWVMYPAKTINSNIQKPKFVPSSPKPILEQKYHSAMKLQEASAMRLTEKSAMHLKENEDNENGAGRLQDLHRGQTAVG